jgi:putative nucleotidyltransferase with HDIG domain
MIAEEIGLAQDNIHQIALGAKLHDIGKLGTPDYVLNKEGPLTPEERNIIQEHPTKGANMLKPISTLKSIRDIIHFHHENLDGTGYPLGLKGDQIPLHAQIVKIADYFDAITSERPYRAPISAEEAVSKLFDEARNHKVDPVLVEALRLQILPVPA